MQQNNPNPKEELRWWETSQPITILGLSAEPFMLVVFIPLIPWWPFVKFIGWCIVVNIFISWVLRKEFTQFLYYLKREFFNNRRRIYSSRYALRRFKGY